LGRLLWARGNGEEGEGERGECGAKVEAHQIPLSNMRRISAILRDATPLRKCP
jgi:hypothetical protein